MHVNTVVICAVIPASYRNHNCHVLLALILLELGLVKDGLGLVVVIVHEAEVILKILAGVLFCAADKAVRNKAFL